MFPLDPARSGSCLLVAASLFAAPAAAGALDKLARSGAVACQPIYPYFCANIHVGCAGRTALPTFGFTIRTNRNRAWIEAGADAAGIDRQYENARIERDADGVILRPEAAPGYVRLRADGRYSLRHYVQDLGTMSHGHCR